MSKVTIHSNPAGLGSLNLKGPQVATDVDILIPGRAGQMMVTGPCFSAYRSAAGTAAPGYSKIIADAEEYDTDSAYDVSTGRFQPLVPGIYQVNAKIEINTTTATAVAAAIYKNGTLAYLGGVSIGSAAAYPGAGLGAQVVLNGSTDFIELYMFSSNASAIAYVTGVGRMFFQANLVRPA